MKKRILIAAPVVFLALTGCTAGAAEPEPTVTVTAPPAPPPPTPAPPARAPTDPITALDAWLSCYSAVHGDYYSEGRRAPVEFPAYNPNLVEDNGDGSFTAGVAIVVSEADPVKDLPERVWQQQCNVSGTIGDPAVVLLGWTDM